MNKTPDELKTLGDEAFRSRNYGAAADFYSSAITHDEGNAVLYANRSAARAARSEWKDALQDAQKAASLDPVWPKAYIRQGIAFRGMYRFDYSIAAYKKALRIKHDSAVQSRILAVEADRYKPRYLDRQSQKYKTVETAPTDIIVALAIGRNIHINDSMDRATILEAIVEHSEKHPNFKHPIRRFYFLPSSDQSHEDGPRFIEYDPETAECTIEQIQKNVLGLLGSAYTDTEILYSEDRAEIMRGNVKGVGVGHIYKSWELIMDDECISHGRPLNNNACHLIHRPRTFGPILVLEVTHIKLAEDFQSYADGQEPMFDTISYQVIDPKWFESDEWAEMRKEWNYLRQKDAIAIQSMLNAMGLSTVVNLDP